MTKYGPVESFQSWLQALRESVSMYTPLKLYKAFDSTTLKLIVSILYKMIDYRQSFGLRSSDLSTNSDGLSSERVEVVTGLHLWQAKLD
eukprot:g39313.t1